MSETTTEYVPDKGDIIWIQLNPQAGHEQEGRRPAVVLTPSKYNQKTSLAIICPIAKQKKGYPFERELPKGLKTTGVVLCDHLKNLDWRYRKAQFIEKIDISILDSVLDTIDILLK